MHFDQGFHARASGTNHIGDRHCKKHSDAQEDVSQCNVFENALVCVTFKVAKQL